MTATADVIVTTIPDTLLVPNAALRFTPPAAVSQPTGGRGGFFLLPPPPGARRTPPPARTQPRIWILADNNPMPIDVVTGPSDGKVTAVTVDEGSLEAGTPAVVDLATKPSA
jgi:HlyD family secretion protein